MFTKHATGVELCLFDSVAATTESRRVRLTVQADGVWSVHLPGVQPGQLYGYRVEGPYQPELGHRFNPAKLLLDPYAKAVAVSVGWDNALLGAVVDDEFEWGDDRPPRTPWHETVIYEAHIKGLTFRHPEIPDHLRGTYGAMAAAPVIDHLRRLGVTAVELMPVHHCVSEPQLIQRGLSNYWGYNSIAFFAPDLRYATSSRVGDAVREFKAMVRALHAAGIEVILDVVYNHTAEGDQEGPTLSMRGIDNETYYLLAPNDRSDYVDFTGCGNTINAQHRSVLQLIIDSLRYWVTEMHVDGFRFDLASALARELYEVNRLGAFFDTIHNDPVISQVKLIAEPWDVGPGGYQVGHFPQLWTEWNGRYRDAVRRFWRGDEGTVSELATRLAGSADLYAHNGRLPHASINFVTSHDGFSLNDLVSYNDKHNEANGENNADGDGNNLSWNCGAEGPTKDPAIGALRERQKRNFIATLFLSQGVPMLSGGDEIGRSQLGNNNAYCQDNVISWHNWDLGDANQELLDFVRLASRIRKDHPVLRRPSFFKGERIEGTDDKDISWLAPGGLEMTEDDWKAAQVKCIGAVLAGDGPAETVMYILNAGADDVEFRLPTGSWRVLLHTADQGQHGKVFASVTMTVSSRSVVVFESGA